MGYLCRQAAGWSRVAGIPAKLAVATLWPATEVLQIFYRHIRRRTTPCVRILLIFYNLPGYRSYRPKEAVRALTTKLIAGEAVCCTPEPIDDRPCRRIGAPPRPAFPAGQPVREAGSKHLRRAATFTSRRTTDEEGSRSPRTIAIAGVAGPGTISMSVEADPQQLRVPRFARPFVSDVASIVRSSRGFRDQKAPRVWAACTHACLNASCRRYSARHIPRAFCSWR